MEDLLVVRVGRCSDRSFLGGVAKVLDVREYQGGAVCVALVLLSTSNISYVRTDSGVDDDVLFARVGIYTQATQNKKATTEVELLRLLSQYRTGVR